MPLNPNIADMFSAENFKTSGHALIELLADYLQNNLTGEGKVIHWKNPAREDLKWQAPLPLSANLSAQGLLDKLAREILPNSLAIHHPRNLGHQVATPLPMAALCDLVAALSNQAMAIYESGPSATLLERQVIRWLCALIGDEWHAADGVLTSGGAQANLTALLVARQIVSSQHMTSGQANTWKNGLNNQPPLCILASEHAHYSVSRAAGIMGLGTDAVIKVACDRLGRMDIEALKLAHQSCITNQLVVMAVVANAGCTATGSIDDLRTIGTYCNAQKLWLHVDGAHGASALLSDQHRHQLSGLALADSVVWDGHKLMYMPAAVSAVLFKNAQHSYSAFSQEASYLFLSDDHAEQAFNTSYRTLECSKRMMALKLWAAFSLYGVDGLGSLVDAAFSQAQLLAEKIKARPDFSLLMSPQTNILCFRYRADLEAQALNQHQIKIREQLVVSGAFYISQVDIHGSTWLRTTLMNPYTSAADLEALLDTITQSSQALLDGSSSSAA